ncbi:hypothetical protein SLE2022_320660 [Rubroshorea leprosula]
MNIQEGLGPNQVATNTIEAGKTGSHFLHEIPVENCQPQSIQGMENLSQEGVPSPSHNDTSTSIHPMVTRTKSGVHTGHVQTKFPKYTHFMITNNSSLNSVGLDIQEPETIKKALQLPQWVNAMKEELATLHRNNTWTLVPPPSP